MVFVPPHLLGQGDPNLLKHSPNHSFVFNLEGKGQCVMSYLGYTYEQIYMCRVARCVACFAMYLSSIHSVAGCITSRLPMHPPMVGKWVVCRNPWVYCRESLSILKIGKQVSRQSSHMEKNFVRKIIRKSAPGQQEV